MAVTVGKARHQWGGMWLPAGYQRFAVHLPCGWCIASSRHTYCGLDKSCSTVFWMQLKEKTFYLRQKGIGPCMPLLMYNGVSVSLLTRHCAVFLDQCHGKCVNDLELEMRRIFSHACSNWDFRFWFWFHTVFWLCFWVKKKNRVNLNLIKL